jgi:hypothetical protein
MAQTPKIAFSARGSALPLEQLDPREDEASWLKQPSISPAPPAPVPIPVLASATGPVRSTASRTESQSSEEPPPLTTTFRLPPKPAVKAVPESYGSASRDRRRPDAQPADAQVAKESPAQKSDHFTTTLGTSRSLEPRIDPLACRIQ